MASLVAQLRRKYIPRNRTTAMTGSWGQKNMPNLWKEGGRGLGVKVRREKGCGVKARRERKMCGEGQDGWREEDGVKVRREGGR